MIAWLSGSLVCGPKFIVPRHSGLTFKPETTQVPVLHPRPSLAGRRGNPGAADGSSEPSRSGSRAPGKSMNPIVTAAPIRPAPISVASTPNAAASGPTTAKLSGTPPIEISQSRLDTRPSRWPGTSRCSSVNQITTSAVMQLSDDERHGHRLPDRGDQPEPGGHQHPHGPDEVERGHRAPWQTPALAEDERHGQRPHAPRAEHEAEVGRRTPEVVAHHVRHEDLPRSPRGQQAHASRSASPPRARSCSARSAGPP